MPSDSKSTTPAPAPRKRGCLAKLGALLIGCLISLVLAEIVVRIFSDELIPSPIGPRYLYQRDDVIGVDHRPGFTGRFSVMREFDVSISINSNGLRDREFGAKPANTKRILSLGDSFCFGYGVEADETYTKVLERLLNEGGGATKFEAINAGASGRGIRHMIAMLDRHGKRLEPDVVIASFFYVNDLIDILLFPEHTERGGIVMTSGIGGVVDKDPWLNFGVYWSELALWAWRAKFNLEQKARGQAFRLGNVPLNGATWSTEMLLVTPDPKNEAEVKLMAQRAALWKQFETLLATLKQKTEALGAKLVLFTIPQECQTRDQAWQSHLQKKHVSEPKYDRYFIGKQLTAICKRTGVQLFDMVPGFAAKQPKETRFFPINQHFNVAGHAYAAELLAEYLRKRKLL